MYLHSYTTHTKNQKERREKKRQGQQEERSFLEITEVFQEEQVASSVRFQRKAKQQEGSKESLGRLAGSSFQERRGAEPGCCGLIENRAEQN